MAAFLSWLDQHWFNLVQTLGIVGGLGLTFASLRRDHRGRKMGDYLTLVGHHRELWSDAHRRPELARIFQAEVDLLAAPISVMEEEFLNLVIVHFSTGWLRARDGSYLDLPLLAADARAFFSLPIPRVVWQRTTHFRDPQFVTFIEEALAAKPRRKSRTSQLSRWTRRLRRFWRLGASR